MENITRELWFQGILSGSSLASTYIIGNRGSSKKWAYMIGLFTQPLWCWTAWESGLWGWFLLTICYIFTWGRGFYNHWKR